MSIMLVATGISHFTSSEQFVQMIPGILPYPETINVISGILEFLLAIGLLTKGYSRLTGAATAVFFILIFPANINNALYGNEVPGGLNSIPYYPWIRLLFQPFYIWWALWSASVLPPRGK
ncbi:DoxX family protein [Paenibacillus turpanensis]|uniref:DoxX family protein n=1 Tax=Paenibacillus turpanensis TaxID=2689078 RepID=UPI00140B4374|nr:DoxX family protein [Paenibacillus turpanensis]